MEKKDKPMEKRNMEEALQDAYEIWSFIDTHLAHLKGSQNLPVNVGFRIRGAYTNLETLQNRIPRGPRDCNAVGLDIWLAEKDPDLDAEDDDNRVLLNRIVAVSCMLNGSNIVMTRESWKCCGSDYVGAAKAAWKVISIAILSSLEKG